MMDGLGFFFFLSCLFNILILTILLVGDGNVATSDGTHHTPCCFNIVSDSIEQCIISISLSSIYKKLVNLYSQV